MFIRYGYYKSKFKYFHPTLKKKMFYYNRFFFKQRVLFKINKKLFYPRIVIYKNLVIRWNYNLFWFEQDWLLNITLIFSWFVPYKPIRYIIYLLIIILAFLPFIGL